MVLDYLLHHQFLEVFKNVLHSSYSTCMLHSFCVQPAGRLARDCALGRYGIGPTFWRPQPARDGPALTREMTNPQRYGTGRDGPTCLTSLFGSGFKAVRPSLTAGRPAKECVSDLNTYLTLSLTSAKSLQ